MDDQHQKGDNVDTPHEDNFSIHELLLLVMSPVDILAHCSRSLSFYNAKLEEIPVDHTGCHYPAKHNENTPNDNQTLEVEVQHQARPCNRSHTEICEQGIDFCSGILQERFSCGAFLRCGL